MKLRLAAVVVPALLAALCAHASIDALGDFLLPRDAFDGPAHGSRAIVWFALAGTLAFALWALLRAAFAAALGDRGALRDLLRKARPADPFAFVAAVGLATLPMVAGMASLDAHFSGTRLDAVADLFGGSFALGLPVTAVFAVAFAVLARAVFELLCRFHRVLMRAVEAFVRVARGRSGSAPILTLSFEDRLRVLPSLARCTGANRAPPRPGSFALRA